jgi:hypothetical protein
MNERQQWARNLQFFSLGYHRSRPFLVIKELAEAMRIEDEATVENVRLRAKIKSLEHEIERLELELEQERLGLAPSFAVAENQLALFEL